EFAQLDRMVLLQPSSHATEDASWIAERVGNMHPNTPLDSADYGPSTATLVGENGLGLIALESEDEPL
ncbi:MAG: hypothetical protein ACLFWD_09605, partial [Anaerolineales bacterium]